MMRKTIVGIFAHPDDETFAAAGTFAKLSKNNDIYLLCATKGESGQNFEKKGLLPEIREKELRTAAEIVGIKDVFFLGFADGALSNSLYHKLASKITTHLKKLKPQIIVTFEPLGISGHLDHIAVSMVSSFVFWKLKFIRQMWQVCRLYSKERWNYFIYVPPGYKKEEIDKVVDIEDVWDIKVKAMMAYKSQIKDTTRILKLASKFPKKEYFLVTKK
jgi:LmbE family N-acetylglucosaminyl deacetylase